MAQSPSWDANIPSATEDISHFIWSPKVHYLVKKNLSLVPILKQANPLHIQTSYFFKAHFGILVFPHIVYTRNKEESLVNCVAVNYVQKKWMFS